MPPTRRPLECGTTVVPASPPCCLWRTVKTLGSAWLLHDSMTWDPTPYLPARATGEVGRLETRLDMSPPCRQCQALACCRSAPPCLARASTAAVQKSLCLCAMRGGCSTLEALCICTPELTAGRQGHWERRPWTPTGCRRRAEKERKGAGLAHEAVEQVRRRWAAAKPASMRGRQLPAAFCPHTARICGTAAALATHPAQPGGLRGGSCAQLVVGDSASGCRQEGGTHKCWVNTGCTA